MNIQDQYDEQVAFSLSDEMLFSEYIKEDSVKKRVQRLEGVMREAGVEEEKIATVIRDYLPDLIPAGLKGVVRGAKFEEFVKSELELLPTTYEVCFEKEIRKMDWDLTHETPDFYIKKDDKILIGMVQVDLWGGGAQTNRGWKYVFHPFTDKVKVVSVVCYKPPVIKSNSKLFKLFKHGFENKTLCYIKGLRDVIQDFFENVEVPIED